MSEPPHVDSEVGWIRRPVAVMDSGIGGLSVLREIRHQLPHENLLYFADQAHIPYGPRELGEIRAFVVTSSRFLLGQGAKAVVVACNTASAAALHHLRRTFPDTPFVGMEPAVKPAAQGSETGVVGVIATPATFQGELFASLVERFAQDVTVLEQVCPGLVEQVEAGALDAPETLALLRRFLDPLLAAGMDKLVLGCTHYPFLVPAIQQMVGTGVEIIDPSPAVARQTGRVLAERNWLNPTEQGGTLTCFTSGDPARFRQQAARLLAGRFEPAGRVIGVRWDGADRIRIVEEAG